MRRVLLAVLTVFLTGYWLGGFITVSQSGTNNHTYPVGFGGAPWISAGSPDIPSYFRLPFTLPSRPDQAILWIEADQAFAAYLNGNRVASGNDASAQGNLPSRAFDVDRSLLPGQNIFVAQVTNFDARPAGLHIRLLITSNGTTSVISTATPGWRGTGDVTKVKTRTSVNSNPWTFQNFDDSGWGPTHVIPAPRPIGVSSIPQSLIDAPWDAPVIAAPGGGTEMTAQTTFELHADPTDGWIRVTASAPYVVMIGEDTVATVGDNAGVGDTSTLANIHFFNIGPLLAAGKNVVKIHVLGSINTAALYVDGFLTEPDGSQVGLATGPGWMTYGPTLLPPAPKPALAPAVQVGTIQSAWPNGIQEVIAGTALNLPIGVLVATGLITVAVLLAWLVIGSIAGLVGGLGVVNGLTLTALANLPVMLTVAVLKGMSSWGVVQPPFPYLIAFVWFLVALLAIADLGSLLVLSGAASAIVRGVRRAGRGTGVRVGSVVSSVAARSGRRAEPALPAGPGAQLAAAATTTTRRAPRRAPVREAAVIVPPAAPPNRLRRVLTFMRRRPDVIAIGLIAIAITGMLLYRLNFDALWQDEGTSIAVARSMRAHLLPQLPSGLLYWKGEAYHALIAVIGAFTHDNLVSLRSVAVGWYALSILAFGLLLVPTLLPGKRLLAVILTLVFFTAPLELAWAREVRMYQQAQFFTIIFVALFYRALRRPTTFNVAGSMAALVLFYLSHEETFVLFLGIVLVFFVTQRLRWVHNWRWWVFGGAATLIIGVQYLLANLTHPAFLGTDLSNRPFVHFDPNFIWGYLDTVYFPITHAGSLTVVSSLAAVAIAVGLWKRVPNRLYIAAMLIIPIIVISVLFSDKNTRYTFITLPMLFVAAGMGALDLFGFARRVLGGAVTAVRARWLSAVAIAATAAIGAVWVAVSLTAGWRDYGLTMATLTSSPFSHGRVDYQNLYDYYNAHVKPGDQVISMVPQITIPLFIGKPQDASIVEPQLLFMMVVNNKIVDTAFGKPILLTTDQIRTELASGKRLWLFTNNSVLRGISYNTRTLLLRSMLPVAETESAELYFWPG